MISIITDGKTFNIKKTLLDKHSHSLFYNIVNNTDETINELIKNNELIIRVETISDVKIHVDVSQDIMSYIIGNLRGYELLDPTPDQKNISKKLGFNFDKNNNDNIVNNNNVVNNNNNIVNDIVDNNNLKGGNMNISDVILSATSEFNGDSVKSFNLINSHRPNYDKQTKSNEIFEQHSEKYSDYNQSNKKNSDKQNNVDFTLSTEKQKNISKIFERAYPISSDTEDFSLFSSDVLSIINASQEINEIKKKDKKTKSRHMAIN